MKPRERIPGHGPPRIAIAIAAIAMTVIVHGTVIGIFHREAPGTPLVAAPAIERPRAACAAHQRRAERKACQAAAVAQARRPPATLMAARP